LAKLQSIAQRGKVSHSADSQGVDEIQNQDTFHQEATHEEDGLSIR